MADVVLNTINAARLDIKCYSGNIIGDDGITITITDRDGNPVNPASNCRLEVRLNSKSPVLLFFAPGDGLTVVANVITLIKQVDLPGGTFEYDLSQVNADGSLRTFFYGYFLVKQNITLARG